MSEEKKFLIDPKAPKEFLEALERAGHTSVPPAPEPPTCQNCGAASGTCLGVCNTCRRPFSGAPAPAAPSQPERMKFRATPATVETQGQAWIWYDDGDACCEVYGNLAYDIDADELAQRIVTLLNGAPAAQETAEQWLRTHSPGILTENNLAIWLTEFAEQITNPLRAELARLRDSLEILGGRADLEKMRADIAEEKVVRLQQELTMEIDAHRLAQSDINKLCDRMARLEKERDEALKQRDLAIKYSRSVRRAECYTMTFLFTPDLEKLLLLKKPSDHKNPLFRGKWTVPGGLLEASEIEPDGAIREVLEETSLVISGPIPILKFLCNCDPTEDEHEVFVFAAIMSEAELSKASGSTQEPVALFDHVPPDTLWYLRPLRELVISRMRQPLAAEARIRELEEEK